VSSANDNDMTPARRIHVLEHGIEKSLKELAEVEAAQRAGAAERYGTGSSRLRHNNRGNPSSNTNKIVTRRSPVMISALTAMPGAIVTGLPSTLMVDESSRTRTG
jgi:hypothetical protein